eukprot:jgi/Psemu1/290449/fgenesh1_pg.499_\
MFSSKSLLGLAIMALSTLSASSANVVGARVELEFPRFLMEDGNHTVHEDECHCEGSGVHCEHEEDEAFCHCEDGEVHCDEDELGEPHGSHDDHHDSHDDHMCHCDGDDVHCIGPGGLEMEAKCHCEDGEAHCDEHDDSHDDHMCHCDGDDVHCIGPGGLEMEAKCHCEDGEAHCDDHHDVGVLHYYYQRFVLRARIRSCRSHRCRRCLVSGFCGSSE